MESGLANSSNASASMHLASTSHATSSDSSWALADFLQHVTFHLWLLLPVVLLVLPNEPRFVDKLVQNFFVGKNSSKVGIGILGNEWNHDKLRIPLITSFVLLLSATWGLFWALLHLHSKVVSYSVVCGIIFWTSLCLSVSLLRIGAILMKWLPPKFEPEIEDLYQDLCAPFQLERSHFAQVLRSMREIKTIKVGQDYVTEKMTPVDSLSLVLSGRLLVRQSGKLLHVVPRLHFVDSPEWFGVSEDDFFQISATALEESKVLVWHRDKLKLTLMESPYLYTVFEHIIARDVVRKLAQTHDGTCLDQLDKKSSFLDDHQHQNFYYKQPQIAAASASERGTGKSAKSTLVRKNGSVEILENYAYSPSWSLSRISEQEDEEDNILMASI